jgi:geranylgeranyl transferase type-1 subunit beta
VASRFNIVKSGNMTETVFNKERHIKYYLRCLKTFLPHQYTSNDSNRMLLAFFTISGLDILGALDSKITAEERKGFIDWLYHCQVPSGGFRGFTGTDFGIDKRTPENEAWDPANVPATFFALVVLLILGDDLSRVKRVECLQWLPKLQREDGSFGEVLGPGGEIKGGRDLRFCCCAAGTRYILQGRSGSGLEGVSDINVDRLVEFIQACQVRRLLGVWSWLRMLIPGSDRHMMGECRKRPFVNPTVRAMDAAISD